MLDFYWHNGSCHLKKQKNKNVPSYLGRNEPQLNPLGTAEEKIDTAIKHLKNRLWYNILSPKAIKLRSQLTGKNSTGGYSLAEAAADGLSCLAQSKGCLIVAGPYSLWAGYNFLEESSLHAIGLEEEDDLLVHRNCGDYHRARDIDKNHSHWQAAE